MRPFRRAFLTVAVIAATAAFLFFREPRLEETAQSVVAPRPAPVIQKDVFGIDRVRLQRVEHVVRSGQTFSDILQERGIDPSRVHEIAEAVDGTIDVRRIRPGDRFYAYGSDSTTAYLVYQPNLVDFVVIDLKDRIRVRAGERPVERTRKTISGVIEGSLYGAMLEVDGDPALVDRIANEIFAWTIDFQHLQKGDAFTVIYEEQSVDGAYHGIGDVIAVRFDHADRPHYAYRFEQDGTTGYFDEEGNSLRKALLKSPLRYTAITSGYSKRRFHPVQKRYKAHLGTDYAAPTGTPIWSVGDGVVLEAQYKRANGNYVKVRHNGTYTTGYLHMSRIAKGIRPGARVKQGEIIGYVGSTGLATGPHVCYRFWKNGVQVDPRREEMPPSDPIGSEYQMAFAQVLQQLGPELNGQIPVQHLASVDTDLPDVN
jgi:murein DD-endopeptidase MepM/ murein hydrolase activator NlpD